MKIRCKINIKRKITKIENEKSSELKKDLTSGKLFSDYLSLILIFSISVLPGSNDKIMVKMIGGK